MTLPEQFDQDMLIAYSIFCGDQRARRIIPPRSVANTSTKAFEKDCSHMVVEELLSLYCQAYTWYLQKVALFIIQLWLNSLWTAKNFDSF